MRDYLDRLAARALGTAAVLRPRVASPWESTTFETGAIATRVEETVARPAAAAAERRAAPEMPPLRVRPDAASTGTAGQPQTAHEEWAPDSVTPRADTAVRVEDTVAIDRSVHTANPAPLAAAARAESDPGTPAPRQSEPAPSAASPAVVRERHFIERIERLRLRDTLRIAPANPSAAPPPPIEITIGRIDVRAVSGTPSVPAARVRQGAPAMSLRDYLTQRDARRRR